MLGPYILYAMWYFKNAICFILNAKCYIPYAMFYSGNVNFTLPLGKIMPSLRTEKNSFISVACVGNSYYIPSGLKITILTTVTPKCRGPVPLGLGVLRD